MKIGLVQTRLMWEDAALNRQNIERLIRNAPERCDLWILPEMFTTGFTMKPEGVAETMEGPTILWLKKLTAEFSTAITGSIIIEEDRHYYNRMLFIYPDGRIVHYDKRHLFSLAGESHEYTAGSEKVIVKFLGWKICLMICYDLRFPVFSRNAEDYDLLIYIANWPIARIVAWNTLLKARAIENLCYTVGVNRIGEDQNLNMYNGHSQLIDPLGSEVISPETSEGIYTAVLDKINLTSVRTKLGFLNDRDSFTVK